MGTVRKRAGARIATMAAAMVLVASSGARAANDPLLPRQWNMSLVGAPSAWATGTGKGITIAVVDTGVDIGHEDLKAKVVLPGRNFVTSGPAYDDHGHGTHVAGIAAAMTNNGRGVVGTAPDAAILPVKVIDRDGNGTYSDAMAAVRWAADNGAQVINLSLGSTVSSLTGSPNGFVEAIRYAWSKGAICVLSAGNDFVLSSDFGDEPALVVSATTRRDRAATYSNGVGEAEWGIAAPGGAASGNADDDILSTYWAHRDRTFPVEYGDYETAAGTSMAAPHVAGAAAVLRSLGLSPRQTVDRLLATAKDLGTKGRDNLYGHGRLDLAKAVAGLAPPRDPPTSSASGASKPSGSAGAASGSGQPTASPRGAIGGASSGEVADPPQALGLPPDGDRGISQDTGDGRRVEGGGATQAGSGGPARHAERRPWSMGLAALALEAAAIVGLVRARARSSLA